MEPTDGLPSDVVFQTARTICDDMKELANDATQELDQYAQLFRGMGAALKETKDNLQKHAIPMQRNRSKERMALRKKIKAIEHAQAVAKKLEETIELTIDDICQVMSPYEMDMKTHKFLSKIMDEEPTDKELDDIEGRDDFPKD